MVPGDYHLHPVSAGSDTERFTFLAPTGFNYTMSCAIGKDKILNFNYYIPNLTEVSQILEEHDKTLSLNI